MWQEQRRSRRGGRSTASHRRTSLSWKNIEHTAVCFNPAEPLDRKPIPYRRVEDTAGSRRYGGGGLVPTACEAFRSTASSSGPARGPNPHHALGDGGGVPMPGTYRAAALRVSFRDESFNPGLKHGWSRDRCCRGKDTSRQSSSMLVEGVRHPGGGKRGVRDRLVNVTNKAPGGIAFAGT